MEHLPEKTQTDDEGKSLDITEEGVLLSQANSAKRRGDGSVEITGVVLMDHNGQTKSRFESGKPCSIEFRCHKNKKVDNLIFGFGIYRNDDLSCYGTNTFIDKVPVDNEAVVDELLVRVSIDMLNLVEGEYYLNVASADGFGTEFDFLDHCIEFIVYSQIKDVGVCRLDHRWEVTVIK